jgi:hypothetical protein
MNTQLSTENLSIHHQVKHYETWRKGYDEHETRRLTAGVTNGKVFRGADDPNDIVVVQDVADVAKARAWLAGEDLEDARQKAGVIGKPTIRFAS